MSNIDLLAADNIRILSASMVEKAKSGHPGGAMGAADFIHILYSEFLNFDPDNMDWPFRDRFFLDPGHMSPMLYSILTLTGHFSLNDIKNFRQWGSPTPGHPEKDFKRGVENTSGPLGQGHTMAVGAAIAERFLCARFGDWMAHKTYAFISDGGIQEEIAQGAGRIAGHLGLNNLIMFFDSNDIQLSHETSECTSEDTAAKYKAWGWNVYVINGNNASEIRSALNIAQSETEKPTLIIGKTVMGKGCVTHGGEGFERKTSTHGQPISKAGASFEKTIENLGGDPENPFVIFPTVQEYYKAALQKKKDYVKTKQEKNNNWRENNPEKAALLDSYLNDELPVIDFEKIIQKENIASRVASGTVLGHLAEVMDNMIVASADLSNSDKTDGFLKKTKPIQKNDFNGAFFQPGVAELTMAAIANGIALHGGVIPVCGTFFVFSDYMKPAVRLAALMELPVKYVWTHDAFRVGEDGPTHQPVEQEAQIRLMEKLKNHSGDNSMLVLRPADALETNVAWKLALENTKSPTALLLSRQNIKDLPSENRYNDALNADKGIYLVKKSSDTPDIILVANGSEVSTCYEAAELIEEESNFKVNVVSAISEGLFRKQSQEYQNEILPAGIKKIGLTAGLSVTLESLIAGDGFVLGMDHFGYSAPAGVLDEKFGFTPENVINKVKSFLNV